MNPQEREYIVLQYLSDKMEANTTMIGIAIAEATDSNSRNYRAIAARTIGRLRAKNWILRVCELNAWQITVSGRTALTENLNAYRRPPAPPASIASCIPKKMFDERI